MASFTITGTVDGVGEVVVKWDDKAGFDDPFGLTQLLIDRGEQIKATPTGPTYTAADTPPEVALATARAAFDTITNETTSGIPEFDPSVPSRAIP